MKRKLTYFLASFVVAVMASFAFVSSTANAGAQSSCRTQCRVGYDKCVRQASNPGGLNQCKKAYDACLSTCH